jgi:hypothetical protein
MTINVFMYVRIFQGVAKGFTPPFPAETPLCRAEIAIPGYFHFTSFNTFGEKKSPIMANTFITCQVPSRFGEIPSQTHI